MPCVRWHQTPCIDLTARWRTLLLSTVMLGTPLFTPMRSYSEVKESGGTWPGLGTRARPAGTYRGASVFIDFCYLPVNIRICILLHTWFVQTGYVISPFTYAMQTEREWQANINNLTFLPGIVVLLLTVL